jgi:hypothetical protein
MFEQSFVATRHARPWTVALALLGQVLVVGILAIVPMLYVQPLPTTALNSMLSMPLAPPPPPPPPARMARTHVDRVVPRKFVPKAFTAL